MGRWQPLRIDLPAERVRLVRQLRQYVDRCELTAAVLADRTGYSRSSWLRYLNGRRLPPWPAVEGLGRLAHADPEHLRVLWESAARARMRDVPDVSSDVPTAPRRAAEAADAKEAADLKAAAEAGDAADAGPDARAAPAPARQPDDAPGRRRVPVGGRVGTLSALAGACALLAAVLLARPWDGGTQAGRPAGAPPGAPGWPWALPDAAESASSACRSAGCRGLDPYREGCDRGSIAVHRLHAYDRVLTLEYSPVCRASWAEVDTPTATDGLRIATTRGDEQRAAAGGAYTTMVGSGPEAARATVVVDGHQLGVARYDSWIGSVTGSR